MTRKQKASPATWPARVAILGLGPSVTDYLQIVKQLGGKSAAYDEVWGINALGDVFACDRIFHMDDVRIQEIRAKARPTSNIATMLHWLKRSRTPVITSRPHPDYPALEAFPLEDVVNTTGYAYFNSTAAYAMAFALYLHIKSKGKAVRRLAVFGNDFTYPNAHDAEKGRACVEFWLGMAAARGVNLTVAKTSSLMDACYPLAERVYGYDTFEVGMKVAKGRARFSFKNRAELPTAEQIEARYDHSRHPSPLMVEVKE